MINLALFDELFKKRPSQRREEWLAFLEMCELYLKKHNIKKPVVVELGVYNNRQKKFYQHFLDAEHIGIDISEKRSTPDIKGSSHDPETLKKLKKRLNGRDINILFIDASHKFEDVRRDFKIYSPLCADIIAFHDTEIGRRGGRDGHQAWKFWDILKNNAYNNDENILFYSIHHGHGPGIGVMLKK